MVGSPKTLLTEHVPVNTQPIQMSNSEEDIKTTAPYHRKLLIVDDDLLVAKSIARMLRWEIVCPKVDLLPHSGLVPKVEFLPIQKI